MRAAGHALLINLLEWSPSNDSDESFIRDPPNATVSVFSADGSKVRDAVLVLKMAKLESDRLTFDVDVLEGELTSGDGPRHCSSTASATAAAGAYRAAVAIIPTRLATEATPGRQEANARRGHRRLDARSRA